MNLWRLLLAFLCLGVEGEGDPPADPAADPPADDGGSLDELLDAAGEGEGAPLAEPTDEPLELKTAKQRARDLERDLDAERAARRAAEARSQPAPTSTSDPETEREDREIAAARAEGKDVSWLIWQADVNRKLRSSERNAMEARRYADDIADRTAFERLETTNPKIFKRYKERVEQAVSEARSKGQNAPRLAVLRLLLGDDIMNGKVKPKVAKPAEGTPAGTVDRGRTPGVRTDVRGRAGSLTEHEKRRARLENTPL